MTWISYAQNFEDVMLLRALKGVQSGFYIDVGAQHPRIDSVSRAFYDRGWRGIHVEPVPAYAALLRADRPDETVVQAVLGKQRGETTFYVIRETGLSTVIQSIAEEHAHNGFP
ncbi:FkbM family methyltransferase, partial [Acidithiobacillus ferriphilus]